ncbi:hypothetical protein [Williamsia sp.]|uniref:hypothetical protein n=1 Tax=Williamsia sp. TaxID=1872085 RepID=UPI001A268EFB|nr:hypothetical protein [Williamsia sp.]MBJ7289402.1 hypothetical protein [Williamsia sp.]
MNRDISTLRTHVGHPKRVLDRLRDFIADDTHDPRVGDFIARQAATHAWITTGLTTRTLTASEARTLTTGIDAERRDVYNHPDLARGICCIVPGLIARLAAEFATPEAWEQFRRQTRDRGNAIRSSPEAT